MKKESLITKYQDFHFVDMPWMRYRTPWLLRWLQWLIPGLTPDRSLSSAVFTHETGVDTYNEFAMNLEDIIDWFKLHKPSNVPEECELQVFFLPDNVYCKWLWNNKEYEV